jgi:carbon storage regulator
MLVLTRKLGEEIVISNLSTITVKVLEVRSGQVKLGIEAPSKFKILRKELVDASGQVDSTDSK